MNKEHLIANVESLCLPIVKELNYELYYIEYVKENNEYYLRLYIEKEEGVISLKDCEIVSRSISAMLDEKDPIKDSYFLEVSSPGLNRKLYNKDHFKKVIGNEVYISFTKSIEGKKNIKGILKEVKGETVIIDVNGEEFNIPNDKIKIANLEGEI